MKKISDVVKKEAIRLRVEEELSLSQISEKLKIAKSTCSNILKAYPLSKERALELNNRTKKTTDLSRNIYDLPNSKFTSFADHSKFTTNQKGRVAELAVRLRLSILGIETYINEFDGSKYDGIIRVGDDIKKIQIRWARKESKSRNSSVKLTKSDGRKNHKTYTENDLDFLFAYDFLTDSVYVYSYEDIRGLKNAISMKKECLEAFHKLK